MSQMTDALMQTLWVGGVAVMEDHDAGTVHVVLTGLDLPTADIRIANIIARNLQPGWRTIGDTELSVYSPTAGRYVRVRFDRV